MSSKTGRKFQRKYKKGKSSLVTKRYLRNVLDKEQEFKYFEKYISNTIDVNGTTTCLTDMTVGDTDITRDGDKIVVKSIQVRANIHDADSSNAVRIIIFQWFPVDTSSTPIPGDILQQTGTWGIISPYNHDQRNQFAILADKTYMVDTDDPSLSVKMKYHLNMPRKQYHL